MRLATVATSGRLLGRVVWTPRPPPSPVTPPYCPPPPFPPPPHLQGALQSFINASFDNMHSTEHALALLRQLRAVLQRDALRAVSGRPAPPSPTPPRA